MLYGRSYVDVDRAVEDFEEGVGSGP
jgi:hypothetical protein